MTAAEFMTPVTEDKAIAQWTLESMRQITTALNRVTDRLDNVHEKLDAIGERVTRIEANRLEHEVSEQGQEQRALEVRVVALEVDKHRREGAAGAASYVLKHWPSLLSVGGFVYLLFRIGV